MNDTTVQAAPEWGAFRRWYLLIAALLAALLLLMWLMGYGPGGSACKMPAPPMAAVVAPPAPVVAAPAPAPVVAPPVAAPAAPVVASVAPPPAANVYFGLDKIDLPGDVDQTLNQVVTYLKANDGAKALLSGFHDPSGDKAHNADLALNRARAVRAQLAKMGIANERVVMAKPAETTGTGAPREARRVEVSVQVP